ncbi:hypothetical protein RHMOL_Rhmol01G0319100 [Rhododendron molle]|uniref:Uncharacterized protein n=1 Tax=Rhododendron molle TaxID=49168 RepID=A0ACC0Q958_RHOML|nr:hypothetical protein RHMOL_Rhmol01G0319100 [Rhododendron molle]
MSKVGSGPVAVKPETSHDYPTFRKQSSSKGVKESRRSRPTFRKQSSTKGVKESRRSGLLSPTKFLKRIGDKITASLNFVCRRTKKSCSSHDTSSAKPERAKAPRDSTCRDVAIVECMKLTTECIVECIVALITGCIGSDWDI